MTEIQTEKPKYELAKLGVVEKNVAALVKQFDGIVYDVTTTKGMETAKRDRQALVRARTTLEQARKEEKADILERGRFVDATAAKIKETILKYEEPLDAKIKEEEQRKEEIRLEKLRAEQERVAGIQKRIDIIKNAPLVAVNRSADEIEMAIQKINAIDISKEVYQEFEITAVEARTETVATLQDILTEKRAAEAEAARLKAEQEAEAERLRIERERLEADQREREAELQKQQEELDRQKAEQDRLLKEQQEKMDAELAERRAQIEKENDEARARLDAERAAAEEEARRIAEETKRQEEAKAEAERIEAERIEAERQEAERIALAKKAERQAKKLADPVEVIRLVNEAANNDAMSDSHKIAVIKGLTGTFLEKQSKE